MTERSQVNGAARSRSSASAEGGVLVDASRLFLARRQTASRAGRRSFARPSRTRASATNVALTDLTDEEAVALLEELGIFGASMSPEQEAEYEEIAPKEWTGRPR
jgi:hypothetical protein